MKRNSGFTLIELIMVIVILGVLSAFALPRFADLSGDAEQASAEALAGSLRSAANIAHATFLSGGSTTPITLEGNSITIVNGYPDYLTIEDAITADGYGNATETDNSPAASTSAWTVGACTVTYTEAAAGSTPTVAVTGC